MKKLIISIFMALVANFCYAQFPQLVNVNPGDLVTMVQLYVSNPGSAPTERPNAKFWVGTSTTTSGVATFEMTGTGVSSGPAIFTGIFAVMATAKSSTGTVVSVPVASTKIINSGKTLQVNVITGVTLIVLANTTAFAANGTEVSVFVIGY